MPGTITKRHEAERKSPWFESFRGSFHSRLTSLFCTFNRIGNFIELSSLTLCPINLLTLDTVSGSNAELLYRSLDFIAAGVIPRYARAALIPEFEGTTIMYKELTLAEGSNSSNAMSVPPA